MESREKRNRPGKKKNAAAPKRIILMKTNATIITANDIRNGEQSRTPTIISQRDISCIFLSSSENFHPPRLIALISIVRSFYATFVFNTPTFLANFPNADALKIRCVTVIVAFAWRVQLLSFFCSRRELMSHENVTFNDNGTVSAMPSHPLVWVPELSQGRREDDLLILPNIALLVSRR